MLRLSLWGSEVLSKDKPLGIALVDLASLPSDGRAVESWQPLEPAMGMDDQMACGRWGDSCAVYGGRGGGVEGGIFFVCSCL